MKRATGFTIIELLIVIVVIGILAGISLVTYKNVMERARNNSIEVAADAYAKTMHLYKTDHGGYPAAHDMLNNHMLNNPEHQNG